ncbi:MAG: hypothetical protein AB8B51_12305, partial [Sedimentitalea sp.]
VSDLQNTADDIYHFDTEVSQTIDARASRRYEAMTPEQKDNVAALTNAVAERATDDLAFQLTEDMRVIADPESPPDQLTESRYRLGSRLVRAVKSSFQYPVQLTVNVGKALIVLGSVGSGLSVFLWIIRVLLPF